MMTLVQPGTRQLSNLAPLTEKQLRDAERDAVYIFNVTPREQRPWAVGRQWTIPACPEGMSVSEPLKIPGTFYKTDVRKLNDGFMPEWEWVTTDGVDVAKRALGRDAFQHESQDLVRQGCFFWHEAVAPQHLIADATEQWHERCNERVQHAAQTYSVNNGMVAAENGKMVYGITKEDIEAAKVLGVESEHPWAGKNTKLVKCDECGTGNILTAAKCKACDVVINEEAFKRKFPVEYAARKAAIESETKRGPGRPRNEEQAA